MNVLYLASKLEIPEMGQGNLGGVSHVINVARQLQRADVGVKVFCGGRGAVPEWIEHDGVGVRRFFRGTSVGQDPFGVKRSIRRGALRRALDGPIRHYHFVESLIDAGRLAAWLSAHPASLIYERVTSRSRAGAFAARRFSLPLVAEVNDLDVHPGILAQASAIIVPDPASLEARWRPKCHALAWGVDTERIGPIADPGDLRASLGLRDRPTAVFVGSFLPWHGAGAIVEAAPLVLRRMPRAAILMIGAGPDEAATREAVKRSGLEAQVIFAGVVPHERIARYLAVGDVMLAPYTEALGAEPGRAEMASSLKVLEYMAAGKPVIVTAIGNRGGFVEDGVTGWVIPDARPETLADAICSALAAPDVGQAMGRQGRLVVERRYSWQHHTRALIEIFRRAAPRAPIAA